MARVSGASDTHAAGDNGGRRGTAGLPRTPRGGQPRVSVPLATYADGGRRQLRLIYTPAPHWTAEQRRAWEAVRTLSGAGLAVMRLETGPNRIPGLAGRWRRFEVGALLLLTLQALEATIAPLFVNDVVNDSMTEGTGYADGADDAGDAGDNTPAR